MTTRNAEGFLRPSYAIVRKRVSKPTFLDDAAFRSQAISVASVAMSRKGAAAMMGVGWRTLYEWLERGKAHPEVEPYGSFAVDYLRAERGFEHAVSTASALRAQSILEAEKRAAIWAADRPPPPPKPNKPPKSAPTEDQEEYVKDLGQWKADMEMWSTPPDTASVQELEWLHRVMVRRWPDDHGESAHRVPEPEPDGSAYLERTGMQHDQLQAMLKDPPEPVLLAMVAVADDIYQLLLANGWRPNERITDEPGRAAREGDGEPKPGEGGRGSGTG